MRARITWLLITDGGCAYVLEKKASSWAIIFEEKHDVPKNREHTTDRPGRVFESADTSHHAYNTGLDWHERQKDLFAKNLIKWLYEHIDQFDALYLLAPPKFLGLLRLKLNKHILAKLKGDSAKDLTPIPLHQLPQKAQALFEQLL